MKRIFRLLMGIFVGVFVMILWLVFLAGNLFAAEPGAGLDFNTLLGYFAPLAVILLTQVLKIWIQSRWAPVVVIILGGLAALLNVGPSPGTEYIDATVNAGYVSGVAALLYDLIRKLIGQPPPG